MNRTARLIALCAFATLPAFAAHAEQSEVPERAPKFTSTRSAAEVRSEATMPVRITNATTGFIGVTNSAVSRDTIKAQAAEAVRSGRVSQGEVSVM